MLFKCLNVYQTHVSVAKWVTMYTVIPQNFVLKCLKKHKCVLKIMDLHKKWR